MAETVETIEIAKAIRAALSTVAAAAKSGTPAYAAGVKTDINGTLKDTVTENKRKTPNVCVTMRERLIRAPGSAMHEYPGSVRVATMYPEDPFQVDLYTIGRAVGNWLALKPAPTLSLTLRKFDALVAESPDIGNTGEADNVQYMEWPIVVKTGPTA